LIAELAHGQHVARDDEEYWFDAADLALRSSVNLTIREAERTWQAPLADLASNQIGLRQEALQLDMQRFVDHVRCACGTPQRGEMAWISCGGDHRARMDVSGLLSECLAWPQAIGAGDGAELVVNVADGPFGWQRRLERWAARWECVLAQAGPSFVESSPGEHPWSEALRWTAARKRSSPWLDALRGTAGSHNGGAIVVFEWSGSTNSVDAKILEKWRKVALRDGLLILMVADGDAPPKAVGRSLVGAAELSWPTQKGSGDVKVGRLRGMSVDANVQWNLESGRMTLASPKPQRKKS
jgi:hypothetical protein